MFTIDLIAAKIDYQTMLSELETILILVRMLNALEHIQVQMLESSAIF